MLEALIAEIGMQVSPQAMVAMIAGLMGAALIVLNKVTIDGLPASFVAIVFGVAMSWIASDVMLINAGYDRLGAHIGLGASVGAVGGAAMMTIRVVAPELAEKLVRILSKTIEGIADVASSAFIKLAKGYAAFVSAMSDKSDKQD